MQQYQAHVATVVMEAEQELRQRLARAKGFDDVEQAARGVADKVTRELLQRLLEGADEALHQERPAGWQVVAIKERTLVTTVGALRLKRRLYRDERGKARMLLDEELGLPARMRVSPPSAGNGRQPVQPDAVCDSRENVERSVALGAQSGDAAPTPRTDGRAAAGGERGVPAAHLRVRRDCQGRAPAESSFR